MLIAKRAVRRWPSAGWRTWWCSAPPSAPTTAPPLQPYSRCSAAPPEPANPCMPRVRSGCNADAPCPAVHRVHAHGHVEQQQVASKSPTRVAGPLQTLDHIWSTFSAAAEARPSLAEASPNRIAGALLGQTPPRGGVAQLLRGHSCVPAAASRGFWPHSASFLRDGHSLSHPACCCSASADMVADANWSRIQFAAPKGASTISCMQAFLFSHRSHWCVCLCRRKGSFSRAAVPDLERVSEASHSFTHSRQGSMSHAGR